MATLQEVELGVLGPLQVRQYGLPVAIPGAKPRAILTMLGLHGSSVVSADALLELLWGDDPPRTATKALQTHISSLRRALGDGFVLTEGTGWTLNTTDIDAMRYKTAAKLGRKAITAGEPTRAVVLFDQALALWRGVPELPDGRRGSSEKTRWIEGHAALVEDRADALLATGRAAEIVGELESAIAEAPLRERRWGHLMLALYRAGRQGEALGAYKRARSLLAEELGVEPGPDLRRLEAAIVTQDASLELPVSQGISAVTRAVTFLLTDIEGSTAAWEADAAAMAVALARHDEIVEQVVTSRGGRLIKTRGEGDATFSVFDRPSAAAAAAIDLQEAIRQEPWTLREPMRVRVALHTGEVELRDGDYYGRAVNRAARLRSLAAGGQILCSGATAELVIDSLADDVVLADLGTRRLRNLPRPEHVFELRMESAADAGPPAAEVPMERPALPAVLVGPGPFVGRGRELERLVSAWQSTLTSGIRAVLIAGEPGVGKTRLAGEWSRTAYGQGASVLYGRCDEDLGAPYQPFAEALRSLVPCVGRARLRGLRGIEALLPLVPGLADALPDVTAPPRADPDTERYALFDAVVALLGAASAAAPVVLILDDLHWAAKPTLLLLRHLLRFGEEARVQIVGTYRSTDLDRSHPLAAMLADLHRDGTADRLALSGLEEGDVTAYVAEAGYDDEELGRALAAVTGGNPFFLIEALRHVEESGGRWDPSTLPQGVREAVSRRLSRLTAETNKALAAAAVVGARFAVTLVEQVVGADLVDAFDEACKAGIVIEETGGRYRFNHALVRQSLLAELPSVRRMRLHQRIAGTLEGESGADDELLAELAHHYFECAWAGNAAKAVEYCRRAADQAMARVAYEGAAELYDRALHALEELDDDLPDRDGLQFELLIAHCEALLAAGDVGSARNAVSQLRDAAGDSGRLAAWGVCFDSELTMLTHPERLDELEAAVNAAAEQLAGLDDAAGEAKAYTVRAGCLARLGRIGDCEVALDQALTAARRAHEHRRVNAVLANAPLAALWGPNPVPRAGGRCLDVVRLLRITTGSPLVEATSTRCQAVLDAFRGRASEGRRLIESARRTLTELGLRHALLEVDQFAGIIELVADQPVAAEPHLRRAYEGFRRMGLDADTAETAALLARACLELHKDAQADELCTESERLAGHAFKAAIAWRSVRAQLLARRGDHDEARRVAEEAVSIAEHTDALIDHGDACLAHAIVLGAASDTYGARVAAERAVRLYELKGAAALANKVRRVASVERKVQAASGRFEEPTVEPENACVRLLRTLDAAYDQGDWQEIAVLVADVIHAESRRKVVGVDFGDIPKTEWLAEARRYRETLAAVRYRHVVVTLRGERLALTRLEVGPDDLSSGAPRDELLQLYGLDENGRLSLHMFFDVEDMDVAITELDATYARLEKQRHRTQLENAATRADDRLIALFGDNRMDKIGAMFSEDTRVDDRRHGLRRESNDRATAVENIRAIAALNVVVTKTTLALRGDLLCLSHIHFQERSSRPDAFWVEALEITEVDTDGLMVAKVAFDVDDFDAAIAELDDRYLAREAAPHAQTWSTIIRLTEAFNLHEYDATNCPSIDHRRVMRYKPGDLTRATLTQQDFTPNLRTYIEAVHRLGDGGAVVTNRSYGTSEGDFEAEWRVTTLLMIEGDRLERYEIFDAEDVEAALARFNEISRPTPRLENAASQVCERFLALFGDRDWDAIANLFTEGYVLDDRRRTVNAGVRHGRDGAIDDIRSAVDVGLWANLLSDVIAIRGDRLALMRLRSAGPDPESSQADVLQLIKTDTDGRFAAAAVLDFDDIDVAFTELEEWYLADDAAAHARTWSTITRIFEKLNRHELPPTTPDWVSVDRRRLATIDAGDMGAFLRATWEATPNGSIFVKAVHQLSDTGAVMMYTAHGTTQQEFDAEWQYIIVVTLDGDLLSRCEAFDENDLDIALARLNELSRPAERLENAASGVYERLKECFAARDWGAMADLLADDIRSEDRRRVVNTGLSHGRNALVAEISAIADVGVTELKSDVIATRGERLVLSRVRVSENDQRPESFSAESIDVIEIDADSRAVARVVFDPDDIDAAFEELETRYLAGEASAHVAAWSAISSAYAAVRRHELHPTTPGWANIDHRRVTSFAPNELEPYLKATWDTLDPNIAIYIEAVHRLTDAGAVVTRFIEGTSREGFTAEWREIGLTTVRGGRINRSELFDETDLDAALTRFEELDQERRPLRNAASRVVERYCQSMAARDWAAMAQTMAENIVFDDRRRVVNAGVRHGRDVQIADNRVAVELGAEYVTFDVIATRGERLALNRVRTVNRDTAPGEIAAQMLAIAEIGADNQMTAIVTFDDDDVDGAVEELETRYAAGEAAGHATTWALVTNVFVGLNRREFVPTTPDWVNVDHRQLTGFKPGDLRAFVRASWDVAPDMQNRVQQVHRLNEIGAVVTHLAHGTTREGFEAEWKSINIFTFEGDMINRCEAFDESDLDVAIARFEELQPRTPNLDNAASRVGERFDACFAIRDWDRIAEMLTNDTYVDDRRRVVNSGPHYSRDTEIASIRAMAEVGVKDITATAIATRGERLALRRTRYSGRDRGPNAFHTDILDIVEIDANGLIAARIVFDADDIDAAFAELDARYVGGEAAAHAQAWSVLTRNALAFNQREPLITTQNWISIDHRRATAFEPGDMTPYIHATWDVAPDINLRIEAVHRLNDRGAVFNQALKGTSQEGFDAEWRDVIILTVDGENLARCEIFDEVDLDDALARFDELTRPATRLANVATRTRALLIESFHRRDLDKFCSALTPDGRYDDRRKGLRSEGSLKREFAPTMFSEAPAGWQWTDELVAIRGNRWVLCRDWFRDTDAPGRPVAVDDLSITEVTEDGLVCHSVIFDACDLTAAMAEMNARWIAFGEVSHPEVIDAAHCLAEATNRRDWEEILRLGADAAYVNHRQLSSPDIRTVADHMSSVEAMVSLAPDLWVEHSQILTHSAAGLVSEIALKGTSTDGFAIEIPLVMLALFDGERLTRFEVFDLEQGDLALSRFTELTDDPDDQRTPASG